MAAPREATLDPTCWIVGRGVTPLGEPWAGYQTTEGERWLIVGACNCCGACEVGSSRDRAGLLVWSGPPGTPGACHDSEYATRLDLPTRPGLADDHPSCSLRGRYLRRRED